MILGERLLSFFHKYSMNKIEKNINECEGGAPEAIAFGDIAGMGDITFPGELGEGEPGSGDLPLPSGRVYKQVAPFDTFLKLKRKHKKLKKKKNTPNTSHYTYIDDFKTYVDRT